MCLWHSLETFGPMVILLVPRYSELSLYTIASMDGIFIYYVTDGRVLHCKPFSLVKQPVVNPNQGVFFHFSVIGDSQSRCQNGWNRSRSPSPPEFGSEREKELLRRKYRFVKQPYFNANYQYKLISSLDWSKFKI